VRQPCAAAARGAGVPGGGHVLLGRQPRSAALLLRSQRCELRLQRSDLLLQRVCRGSKAAALPRPGAEGGERLRRARRRGAMSQD
jgi:hypothetical protein